METSQETKSSTASLSPAEAGKVRDSLQPITDGLEEEAYIEIREQYSWYSALLYLAVTLLTGLLFWFGIYFVDWIGQAINSNYTSDEKTPYLLLITLSTVFLLSFLSIVSLLFYHVSMQRSIRREYLAEFRKLFRQQMKMAFAENDQAKFQSLKELANSVKNNKEAIAELSPDNYKNYLKVLESTRTKIETNKDGKQHKEEKIDPAVLEAIQEGLTTSLKTI